MMGINRAKECDHVFKVFAFPPPWADMKIRFFWTLPICAGFMAFTRFQFNEVGAGIVWVVITFCSVLIVYGLYRRVLLGSGGDVSLAIHVIGPYFLAVRRYPFAKIARLSFPRSFNRTALKLHLVNGVTSQRYWIIGDDELTRIVELIKMQNVNVVIETSGL